MGKIYKKKKKKKRKKKRDLEKSKLIFQIRTSFRILIISFYSKFVLS